MRVVQLGNRIRLLVAVAVAVALASTGACATTQSSSEGQPAIDRIVSGPNCDKQWGNFDDVVTEIDSRLDVGIRFRKYHSLVSDGSVAYDRVGDADVDDACWKYGDLLRRAYNAMLDADGRWSTCIYETGCDVNKDKKIQAAWEKSSRLVDRAKKEIG